MWHTCFTFPRHYSNFEIELDLFSYQILEMQGNCTRSDTFEEHFMLYFFRLFYSTLWNFIKKKRLLALNSNGMFINWTKERFLITFCMRPLQRISYYWINIIPTRSPYISYTIQQIIRGIFCLDILSLLWQIIWAFDRWLINEDCFL